MAGKRDVTPITPSLPPPLRALIIFLPLPPASLWWTSVCTTPPPPSPPTRALALLCSFLGAFLHHPAAHRFSFLFSLGSSANRGPFLSPPRYTANTHTHMLCKRAQTHAVTRVQIPTPLLIPLVARVAPLPVSMRAPPHAYVWGKQTLPSKTLLELHVGVLSLCSNARVCPPSLQRSLFVLHLFFRFCVLLLVLDGVSQVMLSFVRSLFFFPPPFRVRCRFASVSCPHARAALRTAFSRPPCLVLVEHHRGCHASLTRPRPLTCVCVCVCECTRVCVCFCALAHATMGVSVYHSVTVCECA